MAFNSISAICPSFQFAIRGVCPVLAIFIRRIFFGLDDFYNRGNWGSSSLRGSRSNWARKVSGFNPGVSERRLTQRNLSRLQSFSMIAAKRGSFPNFCITNSARLPGRTIRFWVFDCVGASNIFPKTEDAVMWN